MLKRVSSALPKWRLAITSMALACLAVSTVVWGVRAEDPPKLASLPKLKKTDSQVRRISMPWNSVCPSDGYFVLRSGALVQAAPFQAFVSQLFNDDATDWPSRLADKVNFIEGNLAATVTVLPESQENGNNRTLSLGADSFNASFNAPIDSAKLSSAVRWSAFGTKEQTAPLVEALAKADASARFHSVSERAEKAAQSLDTELQNRLQKMWAEIDVGEATFITVNPLKVDHFENDSEKSLALLEKIESAGASYTPDKSMFQGTIKIGVCLKSDEQAAKWLTNIKSVLGESEDGEAVKVSKVLSSLKATIKPFESGELIVLEGPVNFLQL